LRRRLRPTRRGPEPTDTEVIMFGPLVDEELMAQIAADALARGGVLPELPVYPGSIQAPCAHCGNALWVGPRQQESLGAGVTLLCVLCTARHAVELGDDHGSVEIVFAALGDPYKKRR
jgi:hypothetical protein